MLFAVEFPHLGADLCYSRLPRCMQMTRRDEKERRGHKQGEDGHGMALRKFSPFPISEGHLPP